ncbi:MAG: type II toxin-antitoxin system prevent-host-death family antitoxin [Desulfobacteraceae bacterium]|jgi:prevent-host-death family protein
MVIDHGKLFKITINKGERNMTQIDTITISKFKATCLAVLDNVKRTGRSVLVTRHGKPIAIIDPPPPPQKKASWLGSFKSKGKISGDILSPVVPEDAWHVLND